jgi:hypothetical protein
MVPKSTAIEYDSRNTLLQGSFCQQSTHGASMLAGTRTLAYAADTGFQRAGRHQGLTCRVIDDLGVDMAIAAKDRQARTTVCITSYTVADPEASPYFSFR